MPELPEVETVRRGLAPHLLGQRIDTIVVREPRLRWPIPESLSRRASGHSVVSLMRRGKYLIAALDSGDRLILHLGMSGRLLVVDLDTPVEKHDHVDFELASGTLIRFRDPRRFGALLLWPSGEETHPLLEGMGPEPFDAEFNGAYLFRRSRGRRVSIKSFIMNGRIVVGAGNIYATESLFRAGIRPRRAASRLSRAECDRLVSMVRKILEEAIDLGGTTLRDFAGAHGEAGYFQQELLVYGREGEGCAVCGTLIKRVLVNQRSSFYCPHCQC